MAYTNKFSTIVRVTRDKRFDNYIEDEEDAGGADPLPERIGDLLVGYRSREAREKETEGGMSDGVGVGVGLKITGGF